MRARAGHDIEYEDLGEDGAGDQCENTVEGGQECGCFDELKRVKVGEEGRDGLESGEVIFSVLDFRCRCADCNLSMRSRLV